MKKCEAVWNDDVVIEIVSVAEEKSAKRIE